MPALLMLIVNFLVSRFLVVAAFLANLWAVLVSSAAATWIVRGAVVATLVAFMPVPEWLGNLPGWLAAIPGGVVWGLGVIELKAGLAMVTGAWLFRFFVRACLKALGS